MAAQQPHHDHDHPHDHSHDHGEHPHDHGEHHDHHSGWRGVLSKFFGHSHDHADSIDDALTRSARGIRAVKISLVGLGITAVLQLIIVAITSSVALLADTIHNFSDAMTSIPLWIAFILGKRAANRRYTYGYRRAEDLAGLFVLLMIFLSAVLAAYESINRLINPVQVSNIPIVIAAGIIGFAGNELVALYRIRVGRAIGSAALIADGYHARTDGLTSLAVVFGAIGVGLGFPLADPLVGLLISVAILLVLRSASKQMLGRLMDAVDPSLTDQVERIASATPGVQAVEHLRLRWVGHTIETSFAITVDKESTVEQGHEIAELVRHELTHEIPRISSVEIHVNPCAHDGHDPHASLHHHEQPTREVSAPARA